MVKNSKIHPGKLKLAPKKVSEVRFYKSIPRSARLNKSIGFGFRFIIFAHRGFIIFVRFVSDSWKRQRVDKTAIYFVSFCWLEFLNGFYSIYLQFLYWSSQTDKEVPGSRSHTTGLYEARLTPQDAHASKTALAVILLLNTQAELWHLTKKLQIRTLFYAGTQLCFSFSVEVLRQLLSWLRNTHTHDSRTLVVPSRRTF